MTTSLSLQEIIADIHALDERLREYERKYGMLSEDFYELYVKGELRDEEEEEIVDYGGWAAFYKMRMQRKTAYSQKLEAFLRALRRSAPENALILTPITAFS